MKRICSTAALGLRLTWLRVLGVFFAVGVIQWVLFCRSSQASALESRLDGSAGIVGRLGYLALLMVLYYTLSMGKGGGMDLTLRRLSLPEWQVTAVWSLIAVGYFLMYWAFQTGTCLMMYAFHARQTGAAENLLFLTNFRSEWFHELLPLYEPWGFGRNVALTLGFGSFAALGARNARRGRWNPLCLFWLMTIGYALLSQGDMATRGADAAFVLIGVACVSLDWYWSWRWTEDEAP